MSHEEVDTLEVQWWSQLTSLRTNYTYSIRSHGSCYLHMNCFSWWNQMDISKLKAYREREKQKIFRQFKTEYLKCSFSKTMTEDNGTITLRE